MPIKVLMVLDRVYRFEPGHGGTLDFNYTTLVDALTDADVDIEVTKAHLQTDTSATYQNFSFATPPMGLDLRQFDVIWLIGWGGRNSSTMSGNSNPGLGDPMQEGQLAALTRLMDAGVGVFATGDHDSLGSEMCGHIPRVRAMRAWYGANDMTSPMPAGFPRNFPLITAGRADTTQFSTHSDYEGGTGFVWFENQSDSTPQPIDTLTHPAHPILRRGGADITHFPDHMHEGKALGALTPAEYTYADSITLAGQTFVEFPQIGIERQLPQIIATGQTLANASKSAASGGFVLGNSDASMPRAIGTLSAYEGRNAGVGRIVTGSTFHHYVDINLIGDSAVNTDLMRARAGLDAQHNHGFNDAPAGTFEAIKQVYVNIATWLARPPRTISLILERSTFSQAEAMASSLFPGTILVTVDGLKPDQFPGPPGGITSLDPAAFNQAWAPAVVPEEPTGITITPTRVTSDQPTLPPRLQRFTFHYNVEVTNAAFMAFPEPFNTIRLDAALTSPAAIDPLTDRAWIQLVKAANPFMLDLANNNETFWLSSDLRVFPVVADGSPLAVGADRNAAIAYLQTLVNGMSVTAFEALPLGQGGGGTLSAFPTASDGNNVYNFAVARVRLNHAAAEATGVRVFFRIVPSPTTALLTYHEAMGVPTGSYMQTAGANPIALPGEDSGHTDWLSFPVFAHSRMSPTTSQTDDFNAKAMGPGNDDTFYGALIDNNLTDPYLTAAPSGGPMRTLPELMVGEHQCIVAQIVYPPAPIPDGANPGTSDKLAQRNLALSTIANPGLDASRMALHTFEIEATPQPIADGFPPDELLLDWGKAAPPDGTEVHLHIPSWNSADVIALADRFYPRHELRALDAETVALPGGGTRYVPIPRGFARRTGVIVAQFPLGVKSGDRFDLSVRQISTRGRPADIPPPMVTHISQEEAAELLAGRDGQPVPGFAAAAPAAAAPGVFDLGDNRVLITDLRVLDDAGDHAVLIEHPDPGLVAAAQAEAGSWRETIGAFQLGIPVSVKRDMLHHHLRLLSVLRWRAQYLRPNDRWHAAFHLYVELIADKVRALGGDPWQVPPTPDGDIPPPGGDGGDGDGYGGGAHQPWHRYWYWHWLLILLLVLLILLVWAMTRP